MKTTFNEARQIVEAMSRNYHDETYELERMCFSALDSINIGGEEFAVQATAQRLFANRLQIPHSYLARCSRGLQAYNLNYWLEQEKRQRDTLFCRFDGRSLRAVFTDRYKALDNAEILGKMSESGFRSDAEVHLNLNQSLMVVKVPDYDRMFDLNADKMAPGIAVANSEVGVLAFSIEAYFYRLVCTNGLITKTEVTSKFRHISYKALADFNHLLEQVISESRREQRHLSVSAERTVENPEATIASFNRRFLVTKKEAEAVETAWRAEPGGTMFAVINAYTRAAQDRELDHEERHKLERIGGQILSLTR